MRTTIYEFLMKSKELAGCHQTLSARVGSGDETNILPESGPQFSFGVRAQTMQWDHLHVKQMKGLGTRQEDTYSSSSSLLSTLFRSTAVNPDAGSKFTTSRNMGLGVVFWI